jgi:Uma2 family endonuclease
MPTALAKPQESLEPRRRLWSREEFHRAGHAGLFGPEERLELIGGEIVRKVTPQNTPHATAVLLGEEALRGLFPSGHVVRAQLPLALGPDSEPEPDLAVVGGAIRDYEQAHPSTAVLVVEVADATLAFDRTMKAGLYASVGIPEYWIVNLQDRVLECHREPAPMTDQPFGHHYRSITRHPEPGTIAPAAAAGRPVAVADLLPRAGAARA